MFTSDTPATPRGNLNEIAGQLTIKTPTEMHPFIEQKCKEQISVKLLTASVLKNKQNHMVLCLLLQLAYTLNKTRTGTLSTSNKTNIKIG